MCSNVEAPWDVAQESSEVFWQSSGNSSRCRKCSNDLREFSGTIRQSSESIGKFRIMIGNVGTTELKFTEICDLNWLLKISIPFSIFLTNATYWTSACEIYFRGFCSKVERWLFRVVSSRQNWASWTTSNPMTTRKSMQPVLSGLFIKIRVWIEQNPRNRLIRGN